MENTETAQMARKTAGRPAMPEAEKQTLVPLRFPPELLARIDAEREWRLDGPSRSAIIRELIVLGLEASAKKARK